MLKAQARTGQFQDRSDLPDGTYSLEVPLRGLRRSDAGRRRDGETPPEIGASLLVWNAMMGPAKRQLLIRRPPRHVRMFGACCRWASSPTSSWRRRRSRPGWRASRRGASGPALKLGGTEAGRDPTWRCRRCGFAGKLRLVATDSDRAREPRAASRRLSAQADAPFARCGKRRHIRSVRDLAGRST